MCVRRFARARAWRLVMADKDRSTEAPEAADGKDPAAAAAAGSTATKPKRAPKRTPRKKPPQPLPPWKVLLHNSDEPTFDFVIETITTLTPLNKQDAELRAVEADTTGVALLLTTHKE